MQNLTPSRSSSPSIGVKICLVVCLGIATWLVTATGTDAAEGKTNFVFVMADDQGWGDMAYNGHPHLHTPHFDALAKEGLRFDRFYAAAPVCSPTRASTLTGRTPNRSGVFSWGFSLRPEEITLAEALKPAGYRTAHFGKWHLGSVRKGSPVNPGAQGFDTWLSAENFYDNDPTLSDAGKAVALNGESSQIAVDAAVRFLKDRSRDKAPFLAVVWFGSPHAPHQALATDLDRYAAHERSLQHFYGEITAMDRAFGHLRQSLKDLGLRDNTVLWYCSDNGGLPKLGRTGGRGTKSDIYEGGLRVPGLLEWPARCPQPRVIGMPCGTVDIFPTLLDIAGVAVPTGRPIDGESLLPVLTGTRVVRTKPLGFWRYTQGGIGRSNVKLMAELLKAQAEGKELDDPAGLRPDHEFVGRTWKESDREGHAAWLAWPWKLHRIVSKGRERYELYHLEQDPGEQHDRFEQETARTTPLKLELESWQQSVIHSLNGRDYVK